ncbi:hypothetical protein LX32DRAFT_288314 [Colletotrichum zoysiae]|uniref:Uncharacterized protein n=1 Tax=Colletotrichum zoysiae TaxID=1216348 RepID=A0AAD9HLP8_9PEZI|nr:hypothetical protein LX32DRAFT_288314 [Colletotrichum zoysiae]
MAPRFLPSLLSLSRLFPFLSHSLHPIRVSLSLSLSLESLFPTLPTYLLLYDFFLKVVCDLSSPPLPCPVLSCLACPALYCAVLRCTALHSTIILYRLYSIAPRLSHAPLFWAILLSPIFSVCSTEWQSAPYLLLLSRQWSLFCVCLAILSHTHTHTHKTPPTTQPLHRISCKLATKEATLRYQPCLLYTSPPFPIPPIPPLPFQNFCVPACLPACLLYLPLPPLHAHPSAQPNQSQSDCNCVSSLRGTAERTVAAGNRCKNRKKRVRERERKGRKKK